MKNSKYRIIVAVVLVILLVSVLVSACNGFGGLLGGSGTTSTAGVPTQSRIFTPTGQTRILVDSPVQIQSGFAVEGISRVELLVNKKLQRADIPANGRVTQEWTPNTTGSHTIEVVAVDINNRELHKLTTNVQVIENAVVEAVSAPPATGDSPAPAPLPGGQANQNADGSAFQAQSSCSFNTPGEPVSNPNAPTLNRFYIGGINADVEVSVALAKEIGEILVIEWDVSNADSFLLNIQDPSGSSKTISSENGVERIEYPIQESGRHKVTFNARNEQCSSTIEKDANVSPIVIATDTPTPISGGGQHPTPPPPPTATPFYPPPPPIPGVPYGPTQAELPELRPPVCDAADYIDVYTPNTSDRITIREPDMIPAKTAGGTLVHRAWMIQNTGTCTWGPGYELAFYGGRSMGSGGMAFESFFPNEPDRRNTVQQPDRLIAPEGKPNQKAVVEVLLNAPVTPGIHQSYWRMRNPQGVYFGPIVGITLEVVRECTFGIYGAPVINYFNILGVDLDREDSDQIVYRPENPIDVSTTIGRQVTLEWSITNAENYDVIVTSPTGETKNLATNDQTDRAIFVPNTVGDYKVTLYADNGPCTVKADNITIRVSPQNAPSSFALSITRASNNPTNLIAGWDHKDPEVNNVILTAQRYERKKGTQCVLFSPGSVPSSLKGMLCEDNQWGKWAPVAPLPNEINDAGESYVPPAIGIASPFVPPEIIGVTGPNVPSDVTRKVPDLILSAQSSAVVGNLTVIQGEGASAAAPVGDTPQGSATVTNVEWALCPVEPDPNVEVVIRYIAYATINGNEAIPVWSNDVMLPCYNSPLASGSSVTNFSSKTPPPTPSFK